MRVSLLVMVALSMTGCASVRRAPGAAARWVGEETARAVGDVVSPPPGLPRRTRNVAAFLPGGGWLYLDNQVLFNKPAELPGWEVRWWGPSLLYMVGAAALGISAANGIRHHDSRQTMGSAVGLVGLQFSGALTSTRAAMRYEKAHPPSQ